MQTFVLPRVLAPIALSLALVGCTGKVGEIGELPESDAGTGGETDAATGGETIGPSGSSGVPTTASSGSSDESDTDDEIGACNQVGSALCCRFDRDRDNVPFEEDNAPDAPNPRQDDLDGDGLADVADLCPTIEGDANSSADSDADGIGNACDRCGATITQYNVDETVPFALQVRNIPTNADFDGDGIGDACDNCVATPNCGDWGPGNPHIVGESTEGAAGCQTDNNEDGIGDSCEGSMAPGAAGPVGFADADDFDQDGLTNAADACPRLPLAGNRIDCEPGGNTCPDGRTCAATGVCDHLDSDGDGVGDACDTCPLSVNPGQTVSVEAAGEDDEDGDFVGSVCETSPACGVRQDARPLRFLEVSVNGECCVPALVEAPDGSGDLLLAATCSVTSDGLVDCIPLIAPNPEDAARSLPVRVVCDAGDCVELPVRLAIAPGILFLPRGCDQALASAGITAEENLAQLEPDGPLGALYDNACHVPQVDSDFDGLGDKCDKCPFAFDPTDSPFIDAKGQLWPQDGAVCNGDYLCI